LAWTINGVADVVHFATISTTTLTITEVKAVGDPLAADTTLAVAKVMLVPREDPYELDLTITYSGAFNLSVGSAGVAVEHLYDEDFVQRVHSDERSDFKDSVSMWTGKCELLDQRIEVHGAVDCGECRAKCDGDGDPSRDDSSQSSVRTRTDLCFGLDRPHPFWTVENS
jgi:hypothetical protein